MINRVLKLQRQAEGGNGAARNQMQMMMITYKHFVTARGSDEQMMITYIHFATARGSDEPSGSRSTE